MAQSILFDLSSIFSPITKKNVVRPKKCECDGCNKKLMLTDIECKCKKFFCVNHRYMTDHKCTYDYRLNGIKELEKNLVKVEGIKFEKI
jgi:hypothetical protein